MLCGTRVAGGIILIFFIIGLLEVSLCSIIGRVGGKESAVGAVVGEDVLSCLGGPIL